MADELITKQELIDAKPDVKSLGEAANGNQTGIVVPRYGEPYLTAPAAIKKIIEAGDVVPFPTTEVLLAWTPDTAPRAAKALDTNKIYFWGKLTESETVDSWHEMGWSDFERAKKYTDEITDPLVSAVQEVSRDAFLLTDQSGNVFLKVQDGVLQVPNIKANDATIETDSLGKYAFSVQDEKGYVVFGVTSGGVVTYSQTESDTEIFVQQQLENLDTKVTLSNSLNCIVWNGQSNSLGWNATTVLSTTQPFKNVMYSSSGFVPLVVDNWERPHVTAANYSALYQARNSTKSPDKNILTSFSAGVGGAKISEIQDGSSGFNTFKTNITNILSLDSTTKFPIVNFVQGEQDSQYSTSLSDWTTSMLSLYTSMKTYIQTATNSTDDLKVVIAQPSARVVTSDKTVIAQFEMCRNSDKFFLSNPTYRYPYSSADKIHLTEVGFKLMGAYFGRSNAQIMSGKRPQWLEPIGAEYKDKTITIKFKVPKLPLVLDTTNLASTTNYGFKVLNDSAENTISSVKVLDDTVIIECATAHTGVVTVRYALDYLGTGLQIVNGCSGNLRDSTDDTITILNTEYQMFHTAPHFSLTAFTNSI